MKIIKRNGSEVTFDATKLENAIRAACGEVPEEERTSLKTVGDCVRYLSTKLG